MNQAPMEIDTATAADASGLRQLHVTTWAHTYLGLLPPSFCDERLSSHRRRDWDRLISDQAELGGGVLVARDTQTLLGVCQYGPSQDEDEPGDHVGSIHRLYVHPAAQGHGVGRALLEEAIERLTGAGGGDGALSLTLWALEVDPRARAFYEHLGWTADGARRFDGAWDVRYRKEPPGSLP